MIVWTLAEAGEINPLLTEGEHYLGEQHGPRMVQWWALRRNGNTVAGAVSASPRGATCAKRPWNEVVELARLVSLDKNLTRVALRLWREDAAQAWADRYAKTITTLAAYSDSTRHPGNIYRFDGWDLYDEKMRGTGGVKDRTEHHQTVGLKKLWVYVLPTPAVPKQQALGLSA